MHFLIYSDSSKLFVTLIFDGFSMFFQKRLDYKHSFCGGIVKRVNCRIMLLKLSLFSH